MAQEPRARAQWVKNITDDELAHIYHDQYWVVVRASELPAGLDLAVFDMAVNCGVRTAIMRLQRCTSIRSTGTSGR